MTDDPTAWTEARPDARRRDEVAPGGPRRGPTTTMAAWSLEPT